MIPDLEPTADVLGTYALDRVQRLAFTSRSAAAYIVHIAWPLGGRRGAVIYMLDGETFPVAREIIRYQAGARPDDPFAEPILVAIGYPGASRRVLDYSPHALAPDGRTGGGPDFRRFLLDELRPWIESQFEVDPARQTLMGHSMGGMFVLDTLREAPGAFQTYVASSPSVWWGDRYLARQCAAPTQEARHPARVLISTAEFEAALSPAEQQLAPDVQAALLRTRQARDMIEGNRRIAQALARDPLYSVSFTTFENETHRSAWPRAIAQATRE